MSSIPRPRTQCARRSVVGAGIVTILLAGASWGQAGAFSTPEERPAAPSPVPIRHVVIVDMENQSFDAILGKFCVDQARGTIVRQGTNSPCDGTVTGTLPGGAAYRLQPEPDYGLTIGHSVAGIKQAIDDGKMDGFANLYGCGGSDVPPYACLTQFNPLKGPCFGGSTTCIPNAVALAQRYAISDRTFQFRPNASWTMHMVLGAATIERFNGDVPGPGPEGVPQGPGWGCNSGTVANWWDPATGRWYAAPSCIPDASGSLGPLWDGTVYASLPHAYYVPSIFDRLDHAGIGWKIYELNAGWSICPTFERCSSRNQHRVVSVDRFFADAANGRLPAVSFVIPSAALSEHQPASVSRGDAWLGKVVTAVQDDQIDWASTALFVTWDDCGCFYDHVNPRTFDPEWGVRVPLLAVSPYARSGFTDHMPASFPSILTFIERVFRLRALSPCAGTPSDGCSDDVRIGNGAPTYDLMGMFDFAQIPIQAPSPLVTSVRLPADERRTLRRLLPGLDDEAT
jgi:phospholipase C